MTCRPRSPRLLAAGAVALLVHCPALAQVQVGSAAGGPPDHPHNEPQDGVIVVAGHLPTDSTLLEGTRILAGEALQRELKPQLGETLASLPGVSATSFAPGASRPIIRGFDAERVQVLIDGLGSIDASSVSADHAVSLDTLTVDHIDVVHGPAVLLFGGQAIGGAVNVLDRRIPRSVPERPTIMALGTLSSAADERSIGAAIDVPVAPRLVGHLDASWRKTGDLRVGGSVVAPPLRRTLLDRADALRAAGDEGEAEALTESALRRNRVPNTSTSSQTLGAGLAFIDDGGNLGISVQRFETEYGVPARPGTGEQADVAIDLRQTRFDLRGGVELGGVFERLQVRAAYGDYAHVELEGDEVGTRFARQGLEGRAELVQRRRGAWHGHLGVQFAARSLDVDGEEAIVPDNADTRFGVFVLQGVEHGPFEAEAAARFERAGVRARELAFHRSFDLWSGAVGLAFKPGEAWKLGASYLHGARAPSPEELLTNGLHIATQAFEIGDPTFSSEKSDGIEVYARYQGAWASASVTGFSTNFSNFITALPTGLEEEGFPVFQYAQVPARFRGVEAEARWTTPAPGGDLTLEAGADYVRAGLRGAGPVPRIPPLRLRGAAEMAWSQLRLRGEVEWNARQERVARLETPVPGFTLVNASLAWQPLGEDGPLRLILSGENLLDVVGRRAASFTRDYVPIAGRDVRLSAWLRF